MTALVFAYPVAGGASFAGLFCVPTRLGTGCAWDCCVECRFRFPGMERCCLVFAWPTLFEEDAEAGLSVVLRLAIVLAPELLPSGINSRPL